MNRSLVSFAVSAIIAGTLATATSAYAWIRTVPGAACAPVGDPAGTVNCPFISDVGGVNGSNVFYGNSVAQIFADYNVQPRFSANETVQACAISFTQTSGSCGTPKTTLVTGATDVPVPLWIGSTDANAIWDYFWVKSSGLATVIGIGVSGNN